MKGKIKKAKYGVFFLAMASVPLLRKSFQYSIPDFTLNIMILGREYAESLQILWP